MLPDPAAADLEAELDLLGQTLQDTAISPRGGNREPNPPWSVYLPIHSHWRTLCHRSGGHRSVRSFSATEDVSMLNVYSCTVWCSFLQKACVATF